MKHKAWDHLVQELNNAAQPILNNADKYSALLEKIGDSRLVLIGEASHGTQEFYQTRIELSKELIEKKGFNAIAIEGDWPDAYSVHRFIQGKGSCSNWQLALEKFERFPVWMWRNVTMPPFIKWLRNYNDNVRSNESKIGFYGLDLYSLNASTNAVINYLSTIDPEAADLARLRYSCFDHLKLDPLTYGYLTSKGVKKTCKKEVTDQLRELQNCAYEYLREDGISAEDEYFYAYQNARVIKNAERYYRLMYEGHIESWNARDLHMVETLNSLVKHLDKRLSRPSKIILWAHNSHVGDARATEMSEKGEINIGQLVREQYGKEAYLIGFSTYQGTVTAASDWGAPTECKKVNPGLKGSYEELFHQVNSDNFMVHFRDQPILDHYLDIPRLQRAIGVIYLPESELDSHYFFSRINNQFDSVIHFDTTTAVKPLNVWF